MAQVPKELVLLVPRHDVSRQNSNSNPLEKRAQTPLSNNFNGAIRAQGPKGIGHY
jgi:hypothetical protein